jgi:two-component system, sensor histidine kinase LadS
MKMRFILDKNIDTNILETMFKDDNKCLEYLSQLKWVNGFVCKKCSNDNYCDGKVPYSRRCTKCKNEESATANTLFHNIKFPINKAFYIAYEIFKDKKISTFEISQTLSIRQMTCWNFKNRVEDKIKKLAYVTNSENLLVTDIFIMEFDSPFK